MPEMIAHHGQRLMVLGHAFPALSVHYGSAQKVLAEMAAWDDGLIRAFVLCEKSVDQSKEALAIRSRFQMDIV